MRLPAYLILAYLSSHSDDLARFPDHNTALAMALHYEKLGEYHLVKSLHATDTDDQAEHTKRAEEAAAKRIAWNYLRASRVGNTWRIREFHRGNLMKAIGEERFWIGDMP